MPLHDAAMNGNLEGVKLLLDLQAQPLSRTETGEFPIDLAKEHNHNHVVEYLESYKPLDPITKQSEWYHGTLDRNEAVSLLQNFSSKMHVGSEYNGNVSLEETKDELKSGFFLLRFSRNGYVLTLLFDNEVKNFKIQKQYVSILLMHL